MRLFLRSARFVAAVIAIAVTTVLQAQTTRDVADDTVEVCLESSFDLNDLSSGLIAVGWQNLEKKDFLQSDFEAYDAIRTIFPMPEGET